MTFIASSNGNMSATSQSDYMRPTSGIWQPKGNMANNHPSRGLEVWLIGAAYSINWKMKGKIQEGLSAQR